MNQSLKHIAIVSLLGASLVAVGCAEATKTATNAPAASPVPAAAPAKPAGDLSKAKESLEKAAAELKAENYAAAVSAVDAASQELTAAANNSQLPAPIKETIAKASSNLEPIRALIEKKDAGAEKGLAASLASVSKLNEMTKLLSGQMGALGQMMKGAAEKAGETPAQKP